MSVLRQKWVALARILRARGNKGEVAVELLHPRFAVGACRQRDSPIRVQMIHVRERQESVQWRINRCGHRIIAEGAQRIHLRHFVFELRAFVTALQR